MPESSNAVAQNAGAHQLDVGIDLARRVQAAAGVVEVDLVAFVQAGVLQTPQPRKSSPRVEFGVPAVKISLGPAKP
jgi:hypothetical protein